MKSIYVELGFDFKEIENHLGKEVVYISRLYSFFLRQVHIKGTEKIYIGFVNDTRLAGIVPSVNSTRVCLIYRFIDLSNVKNLNSEIERLQFFLTELYTTVQLCCDRFHWPIAPFKKAYQDVIEVKFKYDFILCDFKQSKNKKKSAAVMAIPNPNFISVICVVSDSTNNERQNSVPLHISSIYYDSLFEIFNKLKWINDDVLLILDKKGEIGHKYDLSLNSVSIEIVPKGSQMNFLLDEIKLMNANTPIEEALAILDKRIKFR